MSTRFDNLLLTLTGKGRKQRKVPFSLELRKHLFMAREESGLVFRTSSGKKLSRRNALRDVGLLCQELGISLPGRSLHAFRHSFAEEGLAVYFISSVPWATAAWRSPGATLIWLWRISRHSIRKYHH
jgi:integrase